MRDDANRASNLVAVLLHEAKLDQRVEAERLEAPFGILTVERHLEDEQRNERGERVGCLFEPFQLDGKVPPGREEVALGTEPALDVCRGITGVSEKLGEAADQRPVEHGRGCGGQRPSTSRP